MTQMGTIEGVGERRAFCFIRDGKWNRFFAAPPDFAEGAIPEIYSRVEFSIDVSDERGPRAREIRVIAPPLPSIERRCRCGNTFVIDAGKQAWFAAKEMQLPFRCDTCRRARRPQPVEASAK